MSQERRDPGAPPPRPGFGFGRGPLGRGMPVQKAKDFRGTLRRLVVRLAPHRAQLALVVSAALLGTLFGIVSPKLLGEVTTKLFVGLMALQRGEPGAAIDQAGIGRILLILAGLYLFSNAFGYLQQYVMAGVAQKLVRQLRNDVSAKMARLPLRYFDARPHGEILSRVVNDLDNISTTLQQSLIQVITSVVTFVGVVVMMLTISPLMTLVVFLTLPLSLFVTAKIAKRSQKFFTAQRAALGRLNGHVEEMYTGHAIIKAFGREPTALAQFEAHNAALYEAGWKSQFVSSIIWPLMQLVGNIGYVFVCVAGGILVLQRTIQVGDIQAFIQYARQFSQPLTQIAGIANIIQSTIASAERVFEILDEPEETPDVETPALVSAPRGEVRFAAVRFGYEPQKPLYEALAIHVQRGQTVAVVGPTGAGKTTLVNLLLRFYEIDGGEITIDGLDIRTLRRGELRRLFGMVLQDTW
ncbi:MAG TPA: ABC transporter ATP-binding protein, partial [Limnochordia bacterium]|nr:ABC transporter ATP-binding protein [Limnochordia bacterium]